MANLPYQPFPENEGVEGSLPDQNINVIPAAFGSGIAQSVGKMGETLDRVGQQQFSTAMKLQEMQNETAANKATQDYADYVTQRETQFRQLQGTNAVDAFPAFQKDLQDKFEQTAGTLQSPMAQLAFQRDGRSFYQRTMYGAGLYTGDQAKKANDDSWNGRIDLARSVAALHANDPDALNEAIGNTADAGFVLAHGEGMAPDRANAFVQDKLGDLFRDVAIAKIASGDTDGADQLLQDAKTKTIPGTNLPLLDGNHIAQISQTIANRQYVETQRNLAQEQRDEIHAERDLRQTQAATAAGLAADAASGKPIDAGALANLLRTQQISEAGYNFIIGVSGREAKGDPIAEAHLWERVTARTATPDDVYAGMQAHQIGGTVGIDMVKSLTNEKHTQSPLERGNFGTLRTAVGLDATEKPLIELNEESKQAQVALWTQAQREWNQRVMVQGQDSTAVLNDMLPRYSRPIEVPAAWPKPRLGSIATPQDALAVAQRTEQAFKSGQINQATYDSERRLIIQYKNYYDAEAKRQQAVKSTPSAGGQRAKPLGVTGAPQ